jgi:hypothetical protein
LSIADCRLGADSASGPPFSIVNRQSAIRNEPPALPEKKEGQPKLALERLDQL